MWTISVLFLLTGSGTAQTGLVYQPLVHQLFILQNGPKLCGEILIYSRSFMFFRSRCSFLLHAYCTSFAIIGAHPLRWNMTCCKEGEGETFVNAVGGIQFQLDLTDGHDEHSGVKCLAQGHFP